MSDCRSPRFPLLDPFSGGHGFRFRSSLSGARVFIANVEPFSSGLHGFLMRIRRPVVWDCAYDSSWYVVVCSWWTRLCGQGLRPRSSLLCPECKLCTSSSCLHRCSFGGWLLSRPLSCHDRCLRTRQCLSSPRSSTFLSRCAVQVSFIGVSVRRSVLSRVWAIADLAGSSLHGRGLPMLTSGGCRVSLAPQLSMSAHLPLTRTVLWLWGWLPYSVLVLVSTVDTCRRQYSEALSGRISYYFPGERGPRTLRSISWSCLVGDDFMKMFRILYAWFYTGYSSRVSNGGFFGEVHISSTGGPRAAHTVHFKTWTSCQWAPCT